MISKNTSLTGIMLAAGTTIGAGMFSLPIISSGMWSIGSLCCLVFIWFLNYLGALYMLEINLLFERGSSFDTIVHKSLGPTWNIVTGISIAFLLYILLYAYFSAFGNIASHTLGLDVSQLSNWKRGGLSLSFGCFLATFVWSSSSLVGRLSTILVIGMVVTFIFSMSGFAIQIDAKKLFNIGASDPHYLPYLWATLPYYMTSFGLATIVPSLYKHYGAETSIIKRSLFIGSFLALIVYLIFIIVCFGNISREAFIPINQAGGNMGTLVGALINQNTNEWMNSALNIFSNFAIITSFLGVGLGLFDFVADKFSFSDDRKGRFYAACIAFFPPGIASFFFPNGFIVAIGYAGLVCVFGLFLVPAIIVYKTRKSDQKSPYKVSGGNLLLYLLVLGSLLVAVCQILAKLKILPVWG